MAANSEDVVVCGLVVGVNHRWPFTWDLGRDVAAFNKPGDRVLDHGVRVRPVEPDRNSGVKHLLNLVGALLGVVPLESDGRATSLVATVDGTVVVVVFRQPNSVLLSHKVGTSVVLAKDAGCASLYVAERAVVLELAWSTFGLPWSVACEGRHLALLDVEGFRHALRLDTEYGDIPDRLEGEIVLAEELVHGC